MDPFDLRYWSGFIKAGGNAASPALLEQIHVDSRRIDSKNTLFVALEGKKEDGHDYVGHAARAGARFAIVRHDFTLPKHAEEIGLLYVDDPLKALQEIAMTYRSQKKCQVIAITGSFGKTMVKDLLFDLVCQNACCFASPESFNSQLGVALSLLKIRENHEIAFIETAVSKQGEMDALIKMMQPNAALLTPIGKKHSVCGYEIVQEEFIKLFQIPVNVNWKLVPKTTCTDELTDVSYWNEPHQDLPHAEKIVEAYGVPSYKITFPDGSTYKGVIRSGYTYFVDLVNMSIKAAWLLGVKKERLIEVLDKYTAEPWRTEIWRSPQGVTFINDTYSSDPQSVDAALHHFDYILNESRKIVFFGGFRKSDPSDLRRVAASFIESDIKGLYLFGKATEGPLLEEIKRLSPKLPVYTTKNYAEALKTYHADLHEEDYVLIKGDHKESLEILTTEFNDSIYANQYLINLPAIKANLDAVKAKLPTETRLMVMVKAMAYGTDNIQVARFLAAYGIDILGVSYIDEGIQLRKAGLLQAIFVLNVSPFEAHKVVKWELEVGVSDHLLIDALQKEALLQNKIIKVHLHLDTGMSRFGCRPEDVVLLAKKISDSSQLKLEGIMTHFACADDPEEDAFTLKQAYLLEKAIKTIEQEGITIPWKHAANSAGAIRFDLPEFNMVRLGLAVFGLYASPATQKSMDLRLAISLVSRIVGINDCKLGESISYGRKYLVEKEDQKIAVLPIGYFDGLHRSYSGKGHVIIRGKKAPMVGSICMDFMMVDVSDIPHAAIGDAVLLFGEDEFGQYLSPEELAYQGGSMIYELITCLGPRIQRIFVYEEPQTMR